VTPPEPTDSRIFTPRRFFVLYLLLLVFLGTVVYVGYRLYRASTSRSKSRVIGPDDDPEFLWRLGRGDDTPPR
jgi:hypothetical protein